MLLWEEARSSWIEEDMAAEESYWYLTMSAAEIDLSFCK